jgi:hypothetical protein
MISNWGNGNSNQNCSRMCKLQIPKIPFINKVVEEVSLSDTTNGNEK